jgi:hypothetical protein
MKQFSWVLALLVGCGGASPPPTSGQPVDAPTGGFLELSPVVASGSRDAEEPGSRISYISAATGDDETGQYYYWDGSQVVDAAGNGYGNDPFDPSGDIRPFATPSSEHVRGAPDEGGTRYADWELYRRGETFPAINGGQYRNIGISSEQPAVLGAWGPETDPRPRFDPTERSFFWIAAGRRRVSYVVIRSVDIDARGTSGNRAKGPGAFNQINDESLPPPGDPEPQSWLWFEDIRVRGMAFGFECQGWVTCSVNRSYIADTWNANEHNQGAYVARDQARFIAFDSIFYRNGFKEDPHANSDPERTVFDRNFYFGGGRQMGANLDGVISADGGSGGPQLRYGGTLADSLIIEGYWYTAATSNGTDAAFLSNPSGPSTFDVHDNVQLVFDYNTPNLPGRSEENSHPGDGFTVQSGFGGRFERNIVSGQLLTDLGVGRRFGRSAFNLAAILTETGHVARDYTVRDNIAYEFPAFSFQGDQWGRSEGIEVSNNVWADRGETSAVSISRGASANRLGGALTFSGNRFYTDRPDVFGGMGMAEFMAESSLEGENNQVSPRGDANATEGWSAPERTLRTYCEEVLGLTVTSPTGLPEFMELASENRLGAWDERLTGRAVVNYIREGFGLDPV